MPPGRHLRLGRSSSGPSLARKSISSEWAVTFACHETRRPERSNARFVRRLIVPAGALASTSALIVLDTSIDSIEFREAISIVKERAAPEPLLFASTLARAMPSIVTEVYSEPRPPRRTVRTSP